MRIFKNLNELNRQKWLKKTLAMLPVGSSILDVGAGEIKNRQHCIHLKYVSQDFCQYAGRQGGAIDEGLQTEQWDTANIDIVSDITNIPVPASSFDAVLCSEVLEHLPEPTHALDEFSRLIKSGGRLILTAPFASNVHMAPYYYCTGLSKYWYEYHLPLRGFRIETLVAHGDWHALLLQEIIRLGSQERQRGNWAWPLAYAYSLLGIIYFSLRSKKQKSDDLACFGWNCMAVKV